MYSNYYFSVPSPLSSRHKTLLKSKDEAGRGKKEVLRFRRTMLNVLYVLITVGEVPRMKLH